MTYHKYGVVKWLSRGLLGLLFLVVVEPHRALAVPGPIQEELAPFESPPPQSLFLPQCLNYALKKGVIIKKLGKEGKEHERYTERDVEKLARAPSLVNFIFDWGRMEKLHRETLQYFHDVLVAVPEGRLWGGYSQELGRNYFEPEVRLQNYFYECTASGLCPTNFFSLDDYHHQELFCPSHILDRALHAATEFWTTVKERCDDPAVIASGESKGKTYYQSHPSLCQYVFGEEMKEGELSGLEKELSFIQIKRNRFVEALSYPEGTIESTQALEFTFFKMHEQLISDPEVLKENNAYNARLQPTLQTLQVMNSCNQATFLNEDNWIAGNASALSEYVTRAAKVPQPNYAGFEYYGSELPPSPVGELFEFKPYQDIVNRRYMGSVFTRLPLDPNGYKIPAATRMYLDTKDYLKISIQRETYPSAEERRDAAIGLAKERLEKERLTVYYDLFNGIHDYGLPISYYTLMDFVLAKVQKEHPAPHILSESNLRDTLFKSKNPETLEQLIKDEFSALLSSTPEFVREKDMARVRGYLAGEKPDVTLQKILDTLTKQYVILLQEGKRPWPSFNALFDPEFRQSFVSDINYTNAECHALKVRYNFDKSRYAQYEIDKTSQVPSAQTIALASQEATILDNVYRTLTRNRADIFLPTKVLQDELLFHDPKGFLGQQRSLFERCMTDGAIFYTPKSGDYYYPTHHLRPYVNLRKKELHEQEAKTLVLPDATFSLAFDELYERVVEDFFELVAARGLKTEAEIQEFLTLNARFRIQAILSWILDHPDPKYAAHVCYLLGQLTGNEESLQALFKVAMAAQGTSVFLLFTGIGAPIAIFLNGTLVFLSIVDSLILVSQMQLKSDHIGNIQSAVAQGQMDPWNAADAVGDIERAKRIDEGFLALNAVFFLAGDLALLKSYAQDIRTALSYRSAAKRAIRNARLAEIEKMGARQGSPRNFANEFDASPGRQSGDWEKVLKRVSDKDLTSDDAYRKFIKALDAGQAPRYVADEMPDVFLKRPGGINPAAIPAKLLGSAASKIGSTKLAYRIRLQTALRLHRLFRRALNFHETLAELLTEGLKVTKAGKAHLTAEEAEALVAKINSSEKEEILDYILDHTKTKVSVKLRKYRERGSALETLFENHSGFNAETKAYLESLLQTQMLTYDDFLRLIRKIDKLLETTPANTWTVEIEAKALKQILEYASMRKDVVSHYVIDGIQGAFGYGSPFAYKPIRIESQAVFDELENMFEWARWQRVRERVRTGILPKELLFDAPTRKSAHVNQFISYREKYFNIYLDEYSKLRAASLSDEVASARAADIAESFKTTDMQCRMPRSAVKAAAIASFNSAKVNIDLISTAAAFYKFKAHDELFTPELARLFFLDMFFTRFGAKFRAKAFSNPNANVGGKFLLDQAGGRWVGFVESSSMQVLFGNNTLKPAETVLDLYIGNYQKSQAEVGRAYQNEAMANLYGFDVEAAGVADLLQDQLGPKITLDAYLEKKEELMATFDTFLDLLFSTKNVDEVSSLMSLPKDVQDELAEIRAQEHETLTDEVMLLANNVFKEVSPLRFREFFMKLREKPDFRHRDELLAMSDEELEERAWVLWELFEDQLLRVISKEVYRQRQAEQTMNWPPNTGSVALDRYLFYGLFFDPLRWAPNYVISWGLLHSLCFMRYKNPALVNGVALAIQAFWRIGIEKQWQYRFRNAAKIDPE